MSETFNFGVAGLLPTNTKTKSADPIGDDVNKIVEDFARLMIAQISNQDPDKPQDATETVTQYSQMLATLGQIKANNAVVQFGQVQVGKDVIGKTITYTKGMYQNAEGNYVDDLRTGIVTEVDFTGESPAVKLAGSGDKIPVESIRQIYTPNQVTSVPQAAATVGKNVQYKKSAPNPNYIDAATTPNEPLNTVQDFSGVVSSINLAADDGIPRLTIVGDPDPVPVTNVISVNN